MSYTFFGDNENIFGYQDLTVKVYYSCAKLNIYLGMDFLRSLTKEQTGGIEPDNVLKTISELYETKVFYNLNEFRSSLSKEQSFVPYGNMLNQFSIECARDGDQAQKRNFCIYQANASVPGFVAYHERMQTFLMWFIEGVTYIDIDDDRWDFFVIYEKLPVNDSSTDVQYCFVGYSTVYRYYAYPLNVRPRVSQFLILPPFQRMKLGSKLLECLYEVYRNSSTLDITVEDPSESFQRMRDIVDCKLCMNLKSFALEKLKSGWSKEMATEAQQTYKLNCKQVRRVYEILRFKATNRNNPEDYAAYRVSIKKRLDAPYQKQITDIEKLLKRKRISEANYTSLLKDNQIPRDYRLQSLQKSYESIEAEYKEIISRL